MSGTVTFGRLKLSNFGPFEELDLSLANRGLVFIRGDNQDTSAADSNGSGKSHLFKGVSWVLYGETPEGDKSDRLIRKGCKDGIEGSLQWSDADGDWEATRNKPRSGAAQLVLEHNGQDVSAPTMVLTQAEINKRLGLDFDTWRNTVLYAQGDLVRFADPATTDSERKLILKRILRLDVIDKAAEIARGKAKALDSQVDQLNREQSRVEAELAGLGKPDELQALLASAKAESQQYQKKAERLPKLQQLLVGVNSALNEIYARRSEATTASAQASEHKSRAAASEATARAVSTQLADVAIELKQLSGDACPTCGSKTSSSAVLKKTSELKQKVVVFEVQIRQRKAEQADALKASQIAKQTAEQITAEINKDASIWMAKQGDVKREIALAESCAVTAKTINARVVALETQLAKMTDRVDTLNARLEEITEQKEALGEDSRHLDFWIKGFGNTGMPSYLMDNIVPELTERANHYLSLLADGDISIRFDTQTQLKSGEAREKLSINWDIEGVPDATPSGGQRKKISIAVDLALMDLVTARERASIDLLLMDEVLDGLDATGRNRIMTLLAELRQKRSTIMVISHDSAISELFENSVIVTKRDKVATLLEES